MATPAVEPKPTEQAPPVVSSARDISADALERNELGIKNDAQQAPAFVTKDVAPTPITEAPPAEVPAPPAAEPPKTDEPKLLAGKYKTVEELEKGYLESQKGFMSKVEQEADKKADALVETRVQERLKTLVEKEAGITHAAEQVVEKSLSQMSNDELLDLQVQNPQEFIRRQQKDTLRAIRASQIQEQWRGENKDILDMKLPVGEGKEYTGEFLVSAAALALAKERPELLSDGTGEAILRESTGVVRNLLSSLRNQGKQEALVVRETVTPLQATAGAAATAPGNQPKAAPTKDVDPLDEEIERRRTELKRISGGNVVQRY